MKAISYRALIEIPYNVRALIEIAVREARPAGIIFELISITGGLLFTIRIQKSASKATP